MTRLNIANSQFNFKAQLRGHFLRYAQQIGQNLVRAGFYIQRESMKIVPVMTGALKASAYTRFTGTGLQTVVEVGYSAAYALFVHEILDYAHGADFNAKYAEEIARLNYDKKVQEEVITITGIRKRTRTIKVRHSYYFNRGENQRSQFLTVVMETHSEEIHAILTKGLVKQ